MNAARSAQTTSVAAASLDLSTLSRVALVAGRGLVDIDDAVLARLVHARLRLARGMGWALFSTFGATFALSLALTTLVGHGLWLGAAIALMGSMAFVLSFLVERGAWRLFARLGRAEGLSEDACRAVYARAPDAEGWIDVLRECGRDPSDADLARFVCPERA